MSQIDIFDDIIVDNFAGGGGASTGIELAAGRPVAIAINHDPDAILLHKTNHPYTEHLQASVWDVDPVAVCRGRPVGLAWFSPDCKHFSKAKGAALVDRNIRGLAWIVLRWAALVRPRVIMLENAVQAVSDACILAVAALREQEERENPEPLTIEELCKVDGEPVFLVDLVHKSDPTVSDLWGGWIVFTNHNQNGFIPRGGGFFSNYGYGKSWIAYRSKTKEDA